MGMKIILQRMVNAGDDSRTIDMTADGRFRGPPPTPWALQILRYAIVVGVLAAGLAMAAFALWFALMLIPIVIGAALVAYAAFRWRLWKARRAYAGRHDLTR